MDIKVLASGSDGNAYLVSDGTTLLMLECGIPFQELKSKTDYFNPMPDACLLTHGHADHSFSVEHIQNVGIPVYMSEATKDDLEESINVKFRIHTIQNRERFTIGTFEVLPLKMNHDVYCLGFLITSTATREKLFFATDTYYIEYVIPSCEYLMVEANYDVDIMNERIRHGNTNMVAKERLIRSHMEIRNTIAWLEANDLSKTKRIYLLHLSQGSSNEADFKRKVQEATGVPVTIA